MTTLEGQSVPADVPTWATGSAVLTADSDTLAVWQVSLDGRPTGAWITPLDELRAEPDTAGRLVNCVERRAIALSDVSRADTVLSELTTCAKLEDGWWRGQTFDVAGAFGDVLERRAGVEHAIAAVRESGRKTTDIDWRRDLGGPAGSIAELLRLARLGVPSGSPAVSDALAVVGVLRWIAGVWEETEQVKNRRDYVRTALGPPEPLPPRWREAALAADRTRLPL
ncbi:DUF6218 family protein [Pseudonocardia oroxyli]|uniref:Uncharacterized protein n=1 Tax=Pseudonocardia oroxyli TaxID=366584 RepID=A0A1G7ZS41_PSEOR|nr:DUF6218 family protein [Pseudonocardia oroxyli]SDH11488.1 hypothetical protein SAMN05216377_11924 [Pseudonocardia oroxyli]